MIAVELNMPSVELLAQDEILLLDSRYPSRLIEDWQARHARPLHYTARDSDIHPDLGVLQAKGLAQRFIAGLMDNQDPSINTEINIFYSDPPRCEQTAYVASEEINRLIREKDLTNNYKIDKFEASPAHNTTLGAYRVIDYLGVDKYQAYPTWMRMSGDQEEKLKEIMGPTNFGITPQDVYDDLAERYWQWNMWLDAIMKPGNRKANLVITHETTVGPLEDSLLTASEGVQRLKPPYIGSCQYVRTVIGKYKNGLSHATKRHEYVQTRGSDGLIRVAQIPQHPSTVPILRGVR